MEDQTFYNTECIFNSPPRSYNSFRQMPQRAETSNFSSQSTFGSTLSSFSHSNQYLPFKGGLKRYNVQNQPQTPNSSRQRGLGFSKQPPMKKYHSQNYDCDVCECCVQSVPTQRSSKINTNQQIKESPQRFTGFLKFFQDNQDYGFLVCDFTGKDVFFHFDDMKDTKITRKQLIYGSNRPCNSGNRRVCPENTRQQFEIHFSFEKLAYQGRYGQSFKAVNIFLNYVKGLPEISKKKNGVSQKNSQNSSTASNHSLEKITHVYNKSSEQFFQDEKVLNPEECFSTIPQLSQSEKKEDQETQIQDTMLEKLKVQLLKMLNEEEDNTQDPKYVSK